MPGKLSIDSYGKSNVRVTKVIRLPDRHELVELSVNVQLWGDFSRSFTHGDNASLIATDSMKNTVYVLAKTHPMDSPESFALSLADHFVTTYPHVRRARIAADQTSWRRIDVAGRPHPTAFESAGAGIRAGWGLAARDGPRSTGASISNLLLLKTTDSAFIGFIRDRYTTLPETTDRIFATEMSVNWTYESLDIDYDAAFTRIRTALLETFARHKSDAVQQTLFDMGQAALDTEPSINQIQIDMPNKHRVPFNFKPFGLEFDNDVYITTDAPSGRISATIERE